MLTRDRLLVILTAHVDLGQGGHAHLMDQDLDGVDEVGGPGGAGADPAEDLPALELGVGAFAGSALAGMGGVDVFLVLRQPAVAAGLAVKTAASLRNLDGRPSSLVSVVGHDVHVRVVEGVG
ncbi:MAG: hypothetical protein QOK35_734 [Pseudonocardiales bacterium]|nr:hypothetical protein [Pseudonocardiales bacterium]